MVTAVESGNNSMVILQVLTGMRMQPIPDMPAMALSETLLLGGASSAEQGGHVEFSAHSESILAAVRQLEEALEAM